MTSVLQATDFHNRLNTGITNAVNALIAQCQASAGNDVTMALASVGGVDVNIPDGTAHLSSPLGRGPLARSWRYSPRYAENCEALIAKQDVSLIHIHGVWMHPQYAATRIAEKKNIPTILTSHDLLAPWALHGQGWGVALKKSAYLALLKRSVFDRITLYHAITSIDRDSIHGLFPGRPIEIIPNSIDVTALDRYLEEPVRQTRYVLSFGRLHPKKGIDSLIKAFGLATLPRDIRLVIVGPPEVPAYVEQLRALIASHPLRDRIELRPAVWDAAEKYALFRNAWVTAVPSFSETVALVNLEASACFTPTVTTRSTGLLDWEEGGGILIDIGVEALAKALSDAAQWSLSEREERGRASRKLVEARYSTAVTGGQWAELYRTVANR